MAGFLCAKQIKVSIVKIAFAIGVVFIPFQFCTIRGKENYRAVKMVMAEIMVR
jgi:hypothetical protein